MKFFIFLLKIYSPSFPHKIFYNKTHGNQCLCSNLNMILIAYIKHCEEVEFVLFHSHQTLKNYLKIYILKPEKRLLSDFLLSNLSQHSRKKLGQVFA